jgi:transglutaminase-like putative cysteine protease
LAGFALTIDPLPAGRSELLDHEGNLITETWFEGSTTIFSVTSRFALETTRQNVFDWLAPPHTGTLYPPALQSALAPYLRITDCDPTVAAFADHVFRHSIDFPLGMLNNLNQTLYEMMTRELRLEGHPQSPSETLARRRGACRDRAVLFVEICRRHGIAARFVSGYQRFGYYCPRRYMHAWAEVYVPGGGWRGFDPTHGLAVSNEHVPVAAAADACGATPIEGVFFGDAQSRMETQIDIQVDV